MADKVQLTDPTGLPYQAEPEEAQSLIQQGYSQPSQEEIQQDAEREHFTSPMQKFNAAVEGVSSGFTLGLDEPLLKKLGRDTSESLKREEYNPSTHEVGKIAGTVMNPIFDEIAPAFAVAPEAGALVKIGSAGARSAADTMIMQGGDEVAKMINSDPDQTVQSAVSNIGLSGLLGAGLGGGLGAISPLWKAGANTKVGKFLGLVRDRSGGAEIIPDAINEAINSTGINVAPEVKTALSSDPELRQMFSTLQESSTKSGDSAREALKTFKSQVSDSVANALGKTPEEIEALSGMSNRDMGDAVKQKLISHLKDTFDPLSEQFEQISQKFKDMPLPDGSAAGMAEKIAQNTNEYNISPSSPQAKEVQRVMSELPNIRTLEDLRNYQSTLSGIKNPDLYRVTGQIRDVLRDAESKFLDNAVGHTAPELKPMLDASRAGYAEGKGTLDALNDRLHVGSFRGPGSFIKNLEGMNGEDIMRRLAKSNDAGLLELIGAKFPSVAEDVKNYHLANILKVPLSQAGEGQLLSAKALFSRMDKLSPELKKFITRDPGKLQLLQKLTEALPERMGPSGTPRGLDALWKKVPGSVVGMMSMVMGSNPVTAFLASKATEMLGKDMPDAAKLAYLRYLGSEAPISGSGFKAMTEYMHHAILGAETLVHASKDIFEHGAVRLPASYYMEKKERQKLDDELQRFQTEPQAMLKVGGEIGHYMPEHAGALGQLSATAVNFLNGLRPSTQPVSPLDSPIEPSQADKSAWNRTLDIANQPLLAMEHVKDGTITPTDVNLIKTLYPKLLNRMVNQVSSDMTEHLAKGKSIPYTTRLGLSVLSMSDLDSTMTSQSILSAQPKPQPEQPTTKPPAANKTTSMSKNDKMYNTPMQAREMRQLKTS